MGAYSPPAGLGVVRGAVAEYLAARDGGVPAEAEDVYLGAGASDLIKAVLSLFVGEVDGKPPGDCSHETHKKQAPPKISIKI